MMKTTFAIVAVAFALGGTAAGAKGPHQPMFDFTEMDADADGEITKAELDAFQAQQFAQADSNSDGLLAPDEIRASIEARMDRELPARADRRIEKMISRLDTDNDGMLSLSERSASEFAARMFERLDRDGNGTISAEEAQKVAERRDGHRRGKWHRGGMDGNDRS